MSGHESTLFKSATCPFSSYLIGHEKSISVTLALTFFVTHNPPVLFPRVIYGVHFRSVARGRQNTYNFFPEVDVKKYKVPATTFLSFLLLCSTFLFADVSEDVKGQLKYGVRAASDDHWDEAIYRWRKALQLDPNNLMAHNNLAVAYEQMGEYELALEEYQIAYRLNSENQNVKNNLDRFRDFYRKYQRQKQ